MAIYLNSYLGKVYSLATNPRVIRDSAFTRLCESIERDPEFLRARGLVVWQVPKLLAVDPGEKNPFVGQEGKLVVLGGNQRLAALKSLGKTEIKKEWIIEAKDENGNWLSVDQATRFILVDNNPEGISGTHDYRKMLEGFSQINMRLAGIDFSELTGLLEEGTQTDSPVEKAEKGENGEKNEELATFIKHREQTRKDLKEIDDTGFHLLVVFGSFEEKVEFISRSGLTGNGKAVAVNGDDYLDLVFESYAQKMQFIQESGLADDDDTMGDGELKVVYEMFCDGRALAKKMGIELKSSLLHFRSPKLDSQLAELARPDKPQKSEERQQEEQAAAAGFVASAKGGKRKPKKG